MPNRPLQLDTVFRALADPTRRAVLAQLNRGPAAMSDLARPFGMALPSFAQHMNQLEECGLVRSRKQGRVRTYELSPKPLRAAEDWLAGQRLLWERRLDQFDAYAATLKKEGGAA